jgi:RNA polymerase sigma factor (TIGR02999 family)
MSATRNSQQQGQDANAAVAARGADDLTRLIQAWRGGDQSARDALIEQVYANVRAIAAQSRRGMPGATLNTTELAHEALMRVLGDDAPWEDRRHFFHVAAQATRQVLVDAARRRMASKRGGGAEHVELDASLDVPDLQADARLLQIDDALRDLQAHDARRARVVELVYFGGLDRREVAASIGMSETTVDLDLRVARAWLRSALED